MLTLNGEDLVTSCGVIRKKPLNDKQGSLFKDNEHKHFFWNKFEKHEIMNRMGNIRH